MTSARRGRPADSRRAAATNRATTQHRHLPPPPRHPTPDYDATIDTRDAEPSRAPRRGRPADSGRIAVGQLCDHTVSAVSRIAHADDRYLDAHQRIDAATGRAGAVSDEFEAEWRANRRPTPGRRPSPCAAPHRSTRPRAERAANRATTQHRPLPPPPRTPAPTPAVSSTPGSSHDSETRIWARILPETATDRAQIVVAAPGGSSPSTSARSAGTSRQGIPRSTAVALGGVWRHRWWWARSLGMGRARSGRDLTRNPTASRPDRGGTDRAQIGGRRRRDAGGGVRGRVAAAPGGAAATAAASTTSRWPRRSSVTGRCTWPPEQASRRALARSASAAATTGDTIHVEHRPPDGGGDRPRAHPRRPSIPRSRGSSTTTTAAPRSARPNRSPPSCAGRRSCPRHRHGDGQPSRRPRRRLDQPSGRSIASTPRGDTVQRPAPSADTARLGDQPTPTSPAAAGDRRAGDHAAGVDDDPGPLRHGRGPPAATDVLDQFDRILELLEDRIITELERRGGRFRGGF